MLTVFYNRGRPRTGAQLFPKLLLERNGNHISPHGKNNMSVTTLNSDYVLIITICLLLIYPLPILLMNSCIHSEILLTNTKSKISHYQKKKYLKCFQTCTCDHLGVMWPDLRVISILVLPVGRVAQYSCLPSSPYLQCVGRTHGSRCHWSVLLA